MSDLDDKLARLIELHGAEALRRSIGTISPRKRGRPPVDDGQALKTIAWLDAMLLGRGDVRKDLSDNAAAEIHAYFEPGHSTEATNKRIRRKLAGKARHERSLHILADPAKTQRLVSKRLFVKDREALAARIIEQAQNDLAELEATTCDVGQKSQK